MPAKLDQKTNQRPDKKEVLTVIKIISKEINQFIEPVVSRIAKQKKNPYKVLISCLLSLRTKDEVTDTATKKLFSKINQPEDLIKLSTKTIEKLIYPVGFYKRKAVTIKKISKILIKKYDSKVPNTIEQLLELKGVGRKTANIVLGFGFGKPAMAVDTHCHRIPNRFGWINTKNPEETEQELMIIIPKNKWVEFNNMIVAFGQNICRPVGPKCNQCSITKYCLYYRKVYINKLNANDTLTINNKH